jgi:hypothetical protein
MSDGPPATWREQLTLHWCLSVAMLEELLTHWPEDERQPDGPASAQAGDDARLWQAAAASARDLTCWGPAVDRLREQRALLEPEWRGLTDEQWQVAARLSGDVDGPRAWAGTPAELLDTARALAAPVVRDGLPATWREQLLLHWCLPLSTLEDLLKRRSQDAPHTWDESTVSALSADLQDARLWQAAAATVRDLKHWGPEVASRNQLEDQWRLLTDEQWRVAAKIAGVSDGPPRTWQGTAAELLNTVRALT